jgi:hypothetical protein
MAISLRSHSPDVPIVAHFGDGIDKYLRDFHRDLFTRIERIPEEYHTSEYGTDPGKLKTNLHRLLPAQPCLYLDVDGIVLKDIRPLIDALDADGRPYITEVISKGEVNARLEYFDWMQKERFADRLEMKPGATIYAVQSSWAYIDPTWNNWELLPVLASEFTLDDLVNRWGMSIPDELVMSALCAHLQYDPSWSSRVCFFGKDHKPVEDIRADHYILALYGQYRKQVKTRYLEQYDMELKKHLRQWNQPHLFPSRMVMEDKFVNFTAKAVAAAAGRARAAHHHTAQSPAN